MLPSSPGRRGERSRGRSVAIESLEQRKLFAALDTAFKFTSTDPERIMTTHNLLRWQTMDAIINRADGNAKSLLVKAINQAFPPTSGTDSSVYTSLANDITNGSAFSFGSRDKLIDLVSTYKMAQYWTEASWRPLVGATVPSLATMQASILSITASYNNYLATHGITNVSDGAWVGQASGAMGLAVAYDWLGGELSAATRSSIASNLITYDIAPITTAVARPTGGPFWTTTNLGNWTPICIGSAMMASLAIRQSDYNANFTAMNQSGTNVSASLPAHFEDLLAKGLPLLNTVMSSIQTQNGGWDEGPGYQADMNEFLFGLAESFNGSLNTGQTMPTAVQTFLTNINTTANKVIYAATYYTQPAGGDFVWGDGNWSLSGNPINYLIASFASQQAGNNGDWHAAAQQTWNQRSQTGTDTRAGQGLLYRSLFEWTQPYTIGTYSPNGKPAMGSYTLAGSGLPTHYSFNNGYFGPTQTNVGSNENVNVWRSSWDNSSGTAVMFKGGDKRADKHDQLDAASFLYSALGTQWAVDLGNAAGYPGITLPGNIYTRYQTYPQRAVGQNTLVINPTTSDYKTNATFSGTYGGLNPDQGINDGETWPFAAVDGQTFNESTGVYTANVQLASIYERMKLNQTSTTPSTRNYSFNKSSGALTITDTLNFTGTGNEVYWAMHTSANTSALRSTSGQEVALQKTVNGQLTYVDVKVLTASGTTNGYFSYGSLTSALPAGQPTDLWNFSNATQMQTNFEKLSLHLTGVGTSGTVKIVLTPMPAWTGKTSAEVLALLGGGTQQSLAVSNPPTAFAAPASVQPVASATDDDWLMAMFG